MATTKNDAAAAQSEIASLALPIAGSRSYGSKGYPLFATTEIGADRTLAALLFMEKKP